jgi:hypothetical protein
VEDDLLGAAGKVHEPDAVRAPRGLGERRNVVGRLGGQVVGDQRGTHGASSHVPRSPGARARPPRRRRPYEITERGLDELRDWLTTTSADRSQRNEVVLRSFGLWLVDREQSKAFLREELEFHRARLRGMRALQARLDPERPADRAAMLGLEAGVRRLEAVVSWAEWAIDYVRTWPDTDKEQATEHG